MTQSEKRRVSIQYSRVTKKKPEQELKGKLFKKKKKSAKNKKKKVQKIKK